MWHQGLCTGTRDLGELCLLQLESATFFWISKGFNKFNHTILLREQNLDQAQGVQRGDLSITLHRISEAYKGDEF